MKRSTAIRHLVEMAEVATDDAQLRDAHIGWPLEEMWLGGDLLGSAETMELGVVVLVLDLPADELPWLARHPTGEWVGHQLRLGKRPFAWYYRPGAWPAWNPDHRRLLRFWSAEGGLETAVVEALRDRDLGRVDVVEPTSAELGDQLDLEIPVSRRHLQMILERYWDHDWRREHRGFDESPEDHLWRAATAVEDLLQAREELNRP